ncbi:hypothetical protein [Streptomyces sp. NPDC004579]|uniref:hypothetical protein n=1 Tax=Streptomyces sp. NPDC004579 TaxID=3154667 RepID=UPI0033B8177C
MTDDLHAVLARLDVWLEANAPADHAALNPPATPGGIHAIADGRFPLHPDLTTWLGHHDGSPPRRGMAVPA